MANRKRGKCPDCCPDGGAIFEREYDWTADVGPDEIRPTFWQCCNCGHRKPTRSAPALDLSKPTDAQKRRVKQIKEMIVRNHSCRKPDEYEFKKFEEEYRPDSGLLFVTSEYGRKGDEGTYGAIFGRDYRLIMITPRGGVELLNPKPEKGKNGKDKKAPRPRGLWNAVISLVRY